jgi:hypothetical protein
MDTLDGMNQEAADHLASVFSAIAALVSVPVIVEYGTRREGMDSFEDQLAAALNYYGYAVAFHIPEMDTDMKDLPGVMSKFRLQVKSYIDPNFAITDSRPTIQGLTENVLAALNLWTPSTVNTCYVAPDEKPVVKEEDGLLTTNCQLWNQAGMGLIIPAVATPAYGVSSTNIILTCATAGAAIYYTTNGKPPTPRSASSTLYSASTPVAGGTLVKARAFLAGYGGSILSTKQF